MTFLVFGLVIFCIAQPPVKTQEVRLNMEVVSFGYRICLTQTIFINDKIEIYRFMFDTKKFIDSVWLLVLTQIGNQLGKLWTVCDTQY